MLLSLAVTACNSDVGINILTKEMIYKLSFIMLYCSLSDLVCPTWRCILVAGFRNWKPLPPREGDYVCQIFAIIWHEHCVALYPDVMLNFSTTLCDIHLEGILNVI